MANILYGINGEGSGHWTRSKEVITHLQDLGHDVTVVTSGRALTNMKKDFRVEEIFGLSFKYAKGRVDEFRTLIGNIDAIPGGATSTQKVMGLIKDRNINLVITDFEPISCLASNIIGIPAISIDNQHFITRTESDYPIRYTVEANITKAAIELMTSGAEAYLAISFFEAEPKDEKTQILPPILRREIFDLKPTHGDYVLIYLTHSFGKLVNLLKQVNYKFVFYGADENREESNVSLRKFDPKQFLKDLAGAGGVFATAGFSLISEALYLGKPYLAWPVSNQFEQIFNAHHLDRLGYGKFIKRPTKEGIESFLFNLSAYRERLASYPRQDNAQLLAKLDQLIKKLT